jgi:peptidoglycan/xylan/chitin deacetylase (PgdA/CDA1 family)
MEIPIFCYHNALADSLEKDLSFLASNGYRTLVASEIVDILAGIVEPPPKPVGLTFDDGLPSVRATGLPLLERYDARATVFVITGLTPEGHVTRDPLADVLGWDDLGALRDSGRFEIGSHGHRHNPVHVAAEAGAPVRLADYARIYDVPVPYGPRCDTVAIRAVDGTPEYPSSPLFDAETVLVDGAEAPARGLILDDLRASRALLAERLGVDRPHLCLPYGRGVEQMPALAREAGFESIFWSRREEREINAVGDDPFHIVRRKHDFVRRLPGSGRRSLAGLFVAKATRRLFSNPWE